MSNNNTLAALRAARTIAAAKASTLAPTSNPRQVSAITTGQEAILAARKAALQAQEAALRADEALAQAQANRAQVEEVVMGLIPAIEAGQCPNEDIEEAEAALRAALKTEEKAATAAMTLNEIAVSLAGHLPRRTVKASISIDVEVEETYHAEVVTMAPKGRVAKVEFDEFHLKGIAALTVEEAATRIDAEIFSAVDGDEEARLARLQAAYNKEVLNKHQRDMAEKAKAEAQAKANARRWAETRSPSQLRGALQKGILTPAQEEAAKAKLGL